LMWLASLIVLWTDGLNADFGPIYSNQQVVQHEQV
jgi:hypothetical protein